MDTSISTTWCVTPDNRHHFVAILVKQTTNPSTGITTHEYTTYCVQCGKPGEALTAK